MAKRNPNKKWGIMVIGPNPASDFWKTYEPKANFPCWHRAHWPVIGPLLLFSSKEEAEKEAKRLYSAMTGAWLYEAKPYRKLANGQA